MEYVQTDSTQRKQKKKKKKKKKTSQGSQSLVRHTCNSVDPVQLCKSPLKRPKQKQTGALYKHMLGGYPIKKNGHDLVISLNEGTPI